MREWNAEAYHRVSNPQLQWGLAVLDRLPLRGNELVVDVGCGTGRLTEKLLERLPAGRVVATDLSLNMVQAARAFLTPRFGGRVHVACADATALPLAGGADAIFSTATFHWVIDHPALFRSLARALAPGGLLIAQCGGGPNIQRVHDRCAALMQRPEFAPHYAAWRDPWEFAGPETTARRLADAGFVEIETSLVASPVVLPDAAAFREFMTNVVCRPHLAPLPEPLRAPFLDALTSQAALDEPAFELDYWRLNMRARLPARA